MINLGEVRPGTTIQIPFQTFDSNDPSASVTITGLATSDIEIYKDGSMTQRASDAGYTLLDTDGIDLDTIVGIHGLSINLADNTTAGFYSAGSQYTVVVSSITVDAATINFIPVTFTIGYPNALINTTIATLASQTSFTLTNGPAEDDAINGMWVLIHDVASAVQLGQAIILDYTGSTKTVTLVAGTTFTVATTDNISIMGPSPLQPTVMGRTLDITTTGAAGIDWGNLENPSTSNNLSATTTNLVNTITTYTGNTVQTGDSFNRIGPTGSGLTSLASAANLTTAQNDLDIITGSDGVTLATAQALYAPLKPTTAGRTLDVTATGTAGIDWANVEGQGTAVNLSATTTNLVNTTTTNTDMRGTDGANTVTPMTAATSQTEHDATQSAISALNNITVSQILTTQMTESYAVDGTAPTLAQALFLIQQTIGDFSISGTTLTAKKLDGTTTAATYTLDSATDPTSRTRAT